MGDPRFRNFIRPTSDNLELQETTNQDASELGADGVDWSCAGSSVVEAQTERTWSFPNLMTRPAHSGSRPTAPSRTCHPILGSWHATRADGLPVHPHAAP